MSEISSKILLFCLPSHLPTQQISKLSTLRQTTTSFLGEWYLDGKRKDPLTLFHAWWIFPFIFTQTTVCIIINLYDYVPYAFLKTKRSLNFFLLLLFIFVIQSTHISTFRKRKILEIFEEDRMAHFNRKIVKDEEIL